MFFFFHSSIIVKNGKDGSIFLSHLSFHNHQNFGQLSEEMHERKEGAEKKILTLDEFLKILNTSSEQSKSFNKGVFNVLNNCFVP